MTHRRLFNDRITPAEILQVFSEPDAWLSRREIAHALGVGKNNGLIATIEQMVADGLLIRQETATINRAPIFMYRKA